MLKSLELVIADWREESEILRKHGDVRVADAIKKVCTEVAAASEDYTTWLSEQAARMRSGHSVDWLRSRFTEWAAQGHARKDGKVREYRQVVIPQRMHISAAAEAGRIAGVHAKDAA